MSLWKKFKEDLGKAYDQVNVLDGGKSYKTRTSSGPVGMDRIRDVFDANSKQDIANRTARGEASSYWLQQRDRGVDKPSANLLESIAVPMARSINTAASFGAKAVATPFVLGDVAKESIFGTDESYQKKLNSSNKFLNESMLGKEGGLLNAGTHVKTVDELDDPKKMAGTILVTGTDLASFIPVGKAANIGIKGGAEVFKDVAIQSGTNAVLNSSGNVGQQLLDTGKVDPKQVVTSGVTGAVIPVAAYGGGRVLRGGSNQIVKVLGKDIAETADNAKVKVDTPKTMSSNDLDVLNKLDDKAKTSILTNQEKAARANLQAEKDAITVRVTPTQESRTVKVVPEKYNGVEQPKPSSTTSIGSSMPTLEELKARANNTNVARIQAEEIAAKVGANADDVERNIKRYGYDKTSSEYLPRADRVPYNPETGVGIENIDAVVSAELKKKYGNNGVVLIGNDKKAPPLRVMTPEEEASLFASAPDAPLKVAPPEAPKTVKVGKNIVDTTTGEIIEPTKPIIKQLKELPDFDKATTADMPKIEATVTNMKNAFDEWGKAFTPEERMTYAREIAQYSRGEIANVSPRTKEMYGVIKGTLDDMFARSKSLQGKEATFDMYMPEHRPTITGEPAPFGNSFVDSMNREFGAVNKRNFEIDPSELDDPVNLYKNHVEQWAYDNYGHIKAAENPAYANFKNPVDYVKGNETIAKKLAQKTDDEVGKRAGVSRSQAAKSGGILDDLQENYRKNGGDEIITIDEKLPVGNSTKQHRQVLDDIGVYDLWGFHARDNADDIGSGIFHAKFEGDVVDLTPDQLYQRLKQEFGDRLPFDQQTNDSVIRNRQRNIMREVAEAKRMFAAGETDTPAISARQFQELEKDLATEQIKFFAERSDITDNATKKYLNQRVERALSDNRRRIRIADRISNEITSTLHAFYLGLKPTSAAQNLTESARTAGIVDAKYFAQAAKEVADPKTARKVLIEAGEDKNFIKNQSNMPTNYKETFMDKGRNVSMFMFNATESLKDAQMLRALQLHGKALGKKEGRELSEYVADMFNKHAFKGGEFGSLKGTDSVIGRPLWQFAQYPVKDIKLNSQYFIKAITGTNAEQRQAIGYLTKTFGTKAAMMAVTYPLFGWGIQQMFGVNVPKTGPITAIPQEIYAAINDENERSQTAGEDMNWQNVLDRVGRKYAGVVVPGGDYLFNKLGVGEALPDGMNPFSKDNVIAEWERGYGVNPQGQARIEGADNWFDYGRQLIGGKYNTDAARSYFGNTPFSVNINLPGDKFDVELFNNRNLKPLNAQQQAEFDNLATKEEKNAYLNKKHGVTKDIYTLEEKAYKNPAVKEGYQAMVNTQYNPETGKNESDVITPERWKMVQGEKSGELFKLLAEKAKITNKAFGTPYDPIYDLTDESKIKEVLALRSAFTGDDRERKATLRKESWYAQFEEKMNEYYANMGERADNPDYGPTARAKEYFELSKNNPAFTVEKPAIIQQYEKIRESGDEEARKAFYKNNADALNAAYTQRSNEQLAWTNKMRAIEGAEPISQEVWDNATYGYNDDEMSVAKRIAAENGMYLKQFGGSGYGSNGGTFIRNGDFAEIKAAPKPTISKAKSGTIKVIGKSPKKIKMVRNKSNRQS